MRKIFFLVFLLSTLSQAQTLRGIITLTPIKGIGDDTKLSENAKKSMFFSYTYSNNKSVQQLISSEKTSVDTVIIEHPEHKYIKTESFQTTNRFSDLNHYKNQSTSVYRLEYTMNGENFSIKDKLPSYKWTFENQTKLIIGYNCKKATTIKKSMGREQHIAAWYCEDIPVNDGPMDFSGLPGLILQIEIGDLTVVKFEKIKFTKDEKTDVSEPENKSEILSISEYENKMKYGK